MDELELLTREQAEAIQEKLYRWYDELRGGGKLEVYEQLEVVRYAMWRNGLMSGIPED
jgi:hypothetical protein